MTLPHPESHLNDLDHALNEELMKDLPNAKLKHERLPGTGMPTGLSGPPVDPKAGAGAGKWGPLSPTPTMAAQIDCIHTDAQRLIDTLTDMQAALAIIRAKLGLPT
jgi:hypothetical protein